MDVSGNCVVEGNDQQMLTELSACFALDWLFSSVEPGQYMGDARTASNLNDRLDNNNEAALRCNTQSNA